MIVPTEERRTHVSLEVMGKRIGM
jgi:hypothetical protein